MPARALNKRGSGLLPRASGLVARVGLAASLASPVVASPFVRQGVALAQAQPAPAPTPAPPQPPPADKPDDRSGGRSGGLLTKPKDGDQPPPPPATQIAPPVLKSDAGAQYPDQAIKDKVREKVVVRLIVEIDAAGAVKKATVEAAQGHGFDEAAVAAAMKLVYEPAKRNGQPIASKFRHSYEFAPPSARFVGKVATEQDKPVAGADVTLTAEDGKAVTVKAGADGSFTADSVAAGKYKIRVAAEGFEPRETEETIDPAEEVSLTLRLARTGGKVLVAPPPGPGELTGPIEEVEVRGTRPPREMTRRTLEQRELSRIPGTNGDALRAIQNMPGVARAPGGIGLLIVRGSAPNDTNVFIDGTLVPIVYHFGGLSSVVPTEALDKIDFYPGNFSTQYGRVMGGIVDVGLRDPRSRDGKIHGLVQADFIDARALVEGPIFNTGWNFLIAGRRSYVDVWLKPVLEGLGTGVTTAPVYYDYQVMVQKDFTPRQNLRLALFGSDDRLEILLRGVNASEPGLTGGLGFHTGFWRTQARYKNKFTDETELRVTGAVGQDFIDFNAGDLKFNLTSTPITARVELAQKIAPGVTTNVGMDWLWAPYEVTARFPPPTRPGEPPGGPFSSRPPLETSESGAQYRPGIYDELELTPFRGTRIVPGVRLDYSKDTKKWDISPRFVARQDLTRGFPRTTLKGGVGVFHQPPQPQETNPVFGQPGLVSNRATHYSMGVEQEITKNVEISSEGFYKQLDRLVIQRRGNSGEGRVFGVETLLRYKPDSRFFGWVAYTLSRSERRDIPEEPLKLFQFDQTHILTVLGSYRLGRGWEIGGRYRLVSGNLYTPNRYGFYDENSGVYLPDGDFPLNGKRLPLFQQFDVRVDKIWKFKSWSLNAYLDLQNTFNVGNIEGVQYNFNQTQSTFATGLPFLPSFGIRGEI